MQMRGKGFDVDAIDWMLRDNPYINDIQQLDATTDYYDFDQNDCMIFARPCRGSFVGWALRHNIEKGEALYISMEHNVEGDLFGWIYEKVADNVGEDNENIYRILGKRGATKEFHLIQVDPRYEKFSWWHYNKKTGRYENSARGGFDIGNIEPKEIKHMQHWGMIHSELIDDHEDEEHGWIAPNGDWFGCGYAGHDYVIYNVLGTTVEKVENLGFIRCHLVEKNDYHFTKGYRDDKAKMTRKQIRVLEKRGYFIYDLYTDPKADKSAY
ncbi:MAG: hypothetical protein COA52_01015 [Hyphomicrobiales bacterium]|nr:MAG: hypothetical protein COA52_01015 [Hyphomicrobiales bacterium]